MALSKDKAAKLEGRFTKIARTFARNRNLQVVLSGIRCDTDASGTIRLPANADHLSDETQDALEGMLDHEWAHQAEETEAREAGRLSPLGIAKTLKTNRERMAFNVFEDIRIENKYSTKYIGVSENLAANNVLAYNNIKARLAKKGAAADPWWLLGCGIIGQAHGMDTRWMPKATQEMLARVSDLVEQSKKVTDAAGSRALALELVARIKDMAEEPEPKPEPKAKPESSKERKPGGEDSDSEAGEESGSEGEDGESAAEGEDKDGESKSKGSDEAEGDDKSDEDGEGSGSGDSDDEDGDSDPTGSDKDAGSESGTDDSSGESEGEASDGEAKAEGDAKDDGKDRKANSPADEPSDPVSDECRTMADDMMHKDANGDDPMESTKDIIEREARTDAETHNRHIPHPRAQAMDKVRVVKAKPEDTGKYQALLASVRPQVSALRAKILTVLRSMKVRRFVGDKERGTLDAPALYSLRTGNKRIFAERTAEVEMDTVVGILIDQSGSMGCKLTQTRAAVIALSECLSQLGIPFAIWGFDNRQAFDVHSTEERDLYNRFESNDVDVYKDFNEGFKATRARLVQIKAGGNNCDHEFVEWAARQMVQRKESRKILIVMSDGQPLAAGNTTIMQKELKKSVQKVINAGIETFGLGIMNESVRYYYPDWAVVGDISQLAPVMFRMMKDYLLKQRHKVGALSR